MRFKKILLNGLLISAVCSMIILGGCASKEDSSSDKKETVAEEEQANPEEMSKTDSGTKISRLDEFSMQDITGETYTQEMFGEYDLTMVNVFTTWCTPCVNEIPDLEKLHKEMADQGVNVVGIILDAIDEAGKTDETAVEKAELLAEKTGASYPFLIPDEGYLNGRLAGINAVPETFFVDRDGNIVGETYTGSRPFEEWKSVVEKELGGVQQ